MVLRQSLTLTLLASALIAAPVSAVENSLAGQEKIDKSAAASQKKINNLVDQTTSDFEKYRVAAQRLESLTIFNKQMAKLVESQKSEIVSINQQINDIDSIETGALPLMLKMTTTLGDIIAADVPFLMNDRKERFENLTILIDQANVSAGEKYRRIMEAYQIEMEFGRTIEAYRDVLVTNDNSEPRTVDFLRIGRVGLYYQTLDGSESGRWDSERNAWEMLNSSHRNSIRDGLRIARKQMPPELLTLPVNAPAL